MLTVFTVTMLIACKGQQLTPQMLEVFQHALDLGGLTDAAVTWADNKLSFTAQIEAASMGVAMRKSNETVAIAMGSTFGVDVLDVKIIRAEWEADEDSAASGGHLACVEGGIA